MRVASNNPTVAPNNFSASRNGTGQHVFDLFGRTGGTSMLEAGRPDGTVETYVQVRVEARHLH